MSPRGPGGRRGGWRGGWGRGGAGRAVDPTGHGLEEGASGELEGGGLALEQPGVVVGVEDALPQEVVEDGVPGGGLGVVVEPGLEDVLQVWIELPR